MEDRVSRQATAGPSGLLRWPLAFRQWQGARPYQEDAFDARDIDPWGAGESPALLMILADGMGGAAGGAIASHTAVEIFSRDFPILDGTAGARFRACLEAATASLHRQESADARLRGMGTTVVAALYDGRSIEWLSVGDSPMWLFADGALVRLNADHSMAPVLEALVRAGELTPDGARRDRRRNMLRSAVTGRAADMVDCGHRPCRLGPGGFLLIASDGIETLAEDRIAQELGAAKGSAEAAADGLLSAVRAAAGPYQDNVTIMLLAGAGGAAG